MSGLAASQLLYRFHEHSGIALYNSGRNLLIALPGGILDQDPAVFLRLLTGKTHGVIIGHAGDECLCPQSLNIFQPFRSRFPGM